MTEATPDTRERLLDAAEVLFAENGFDATSVRAITTWADANLAAVNYHFQAKVVLITAVFERRIRPINRHCSYSSRPAPRARRRHPLWRP